MKFFSLFFFIAFSAGSCTDAAEKPVASNSFPGKNTNTVPRTNIAISFAAPDISPMDVIYFPGDYPVLKMSQNAATLPVARVIYSRPHKQERDIFGSLIPYNEPWRLGANEATEIEFFQPVLVQNKPVAKGRYLLYCVPEETQWTIIFNTNIYSWGLKQDPEKDVYRFTIPTQKAENSYEYFTMLFEKAKYGVSLTMSWDDVTARLPITVQE